MFISRRFLALVRSLASVTICLVGLLFRERLVPLCWLAAERVCENDAREVVRTLSHAFCVLGDFPTELRELSIPELLLALCVGLDQAFIAKAL